MNGQGGQTDLAYQGIGCRSRTDSSSTCDSLRVPMSTRNLPHPCGCSVTPNTSPRPPLRFSATGVSRAGNSRAARPETTRPISITARRQQRVCHRNLWRAPRPTMSSPLDPAAGFLAPWAGAIPANAIPVAGATVPSMSRGIAQPPHRYRLPQTERWFHCALPKRSRNRTVCGSSPCSRSCSGCGCGAAPLTSASRVRIVSDKTRVDILHGYRNFDQQFLISGAQRTLRGTVHRQLQRTDNRIGDNHESTLLSTVTSAGKFSIPNSMRESIPGSGSRLSASTAVAFPAKTSSGSKLFRLAGIGLGDEPEGSVRGQRIAFGTISPDRHRKTHSTADNGLLQSASVSRCSDDLESPRRSARSVLRRSRLPIPAPSTASAQYRIAARRRHDTEPRSRHASGIEDQVGRRYVDRQLLGKGLIQYGGEQLQFPIDRHKTLTVGTRPPLSAQWSPRLARARSESAYFLPHERSGWTGRPHVSGYRSPKSNGQQHRWQPLRAPVSTRSPPHPCGCSAMPNTSPGRRSASVPPVYRERLIVGQHGRKPLARSA